MTVVGEAASEDTSEVEGDAIVAKSNSDARIINVSSNRGGCVLTMVKGEVNSDSLPEYGVSRGTVASSTRVL